MSYVEMDDAGIVNIRCMVCDQIVARRTYKEIPSRSVIGETEKVLTVKRMPNWRQGKLEFETEEGISTYMEPILCKDCIDKPLNHEVILGKVKEATQAELEHFGKHADIVSEHMSALNKLKKPKKKVK